MCSGQPGGRRSIDQHSPHFYRHRALGSLVDLRRASSIAT
jgi:hypothetical protein